ncbi:MAG: hypothetical protein J5616_05695 [Bacteroidaceae bacterium]|nr:hypothetical protein [Bacteroidaceae bacterium]
MKKISIFVMVMFASLIMWNCKGGTSDGSDQAEGDSAVAENPLHIGMPVMEKFVRVTSEENTKMYKSPSVDSPWRVTWVEDIESDMADIVEKWSDEKLPSGYFCDDSPAYSGDVLAVLGEEGDFYKVGIRNDRTDMEFGYVKKADVEDVKPEKVTDDVLNEMIDMFDWVKVRIIEKGKYKGLALRSTFDELMGEHFDVGVMLDGVLAFPENNSFFIEYDPNVQELTFVKPEPGEFPYYFKYPKSMSIWNDEFNYSNGFNPDMLSDEQIEKIMGDLEKSEFVKYDFVIPNTEGGLMTFWLRSK